MVPPPGNWLRSVSFDRAQFSFVLPPGNASAFAPRPPPPPSLSLSLCLSLHHAPIYASSLHNVTWSNIRAFCFLYAREYISVICVGLLVIGSA